MGFDGFVQTRCMDMTDIPKIFRQIDLLWSEAAVYSIGFSNALRTWASAMSPGGFAAVSELSWLRDEVPEPVKKFFDSCYPVMQSVQQNIRLAENLGYKMLATYTLPSEAWVDGSYDILGPRARSLASHPDAFVRDSAAETVREIEIFESSEDSYGYVFYLLQHP